MWSCFLSLSLTYSLNISLFLSLTVKFQTEGRKCQFWYERRRGLLGNFKRWYYSSETNIKFEVISCTMATVAPKSTCGTSLCCKDRYKSHLCSSVLTRVGKFCPLRICGKMEILLFKFRQKPKFEAGIKLTPRHLIFAWCHPLHLNLVNPILFKFNKFITIAFL